MRKADFLSTPDLGLSNARLLRRIFAEAECDLPFETAVRVGSDLMGERRRKGEGLVRGLQEDFM